MPVQCGSNLQTGSINARISDTSAFDIALVTGEPVDKNNSRWTFGFGINRVYA
jgi:hypothetical protein